MTATLNAMSLPPSAGVRFNGFERLHQRYGAEIRGAFERVLASGWYVLGEEVKTFERELAAMVGVKHVIGVGNGMDAIILALTAAGIQPGQRVATTPLTAFATTLAIVRCGGVPVFVDVDAHGLMDLDALEAALREKPIPFVLPVHLYGQPLELARLASICERNGAVLIEDVAQALGASSGGRRCGSVGKASATSFYPTKNLGAIGDGGAVMTDDDALAESVRSARNYGQTQRYIHPHLGFNSRLDEVQAAILRSLLLRLSDFEAQRRTAARTYHQQIRSTLISLPLRDRLDDSVWHLFPVRVENADRFMAHMKSLGVEVLRHYPVLCPDQDALRGVAHESLGELSSARGWAREEVSLPCHPFLSPAELEQVSLAVSSYAG